MKKLGFLFLLLLVGFSLKATDQEPEQLSYNGEILYFGIGVENDSPLSLSPYTIRTNEFNYSPTTSLKRGFVGCWIIRNDSLFLTHVLNTTFDKVPLDQALAVGDATRPIFASWYTGMLRPPFPVSDLPGCYIGVYQGQVAFFIKKTGDVTENISESPELMKKLKDYLDQRKRGLVLE
ncbi:MAG: hypothetical protein RR346_05815 [Bacteroidales bacterium]